MMNSSASIESDARRLKRNVRGWRDLMSKHELAEYDLRRIDSDDDRRLSADDLATIAKRLRTASPCKRYTDETKLVTSADLAIIAARSTNVRCRHCGSIERSEGLEPELFFEDLIDMGWRREGNGWACCQPARAPSITIKPLITNHADSPLAAKTATPDAGEHSPSVGDVHGPTDTPARRSGSTTDFSSTAKSVGALGTVGEELPGVQQDSTPVTAVVNCDTRGDAPVPRGMVPSDRSPAA